MNISPARNPTIWLYLAICLLTIVIYLPGLSGDYMFDDMENLLENKRLNISSLNTEALLNASFSTGAGLTGRPVSMFSFALNRYFFGIDPYSYKVINLIIHLLTGFGLYLLCRLLIQNYQRQFNPRLSKRTLTFLPLVVAGLWLVHPLNLSPVLYIVQRMASLATLFMVFGLCLYTLGRQRMLSGKSGYPFVFSGLFIFGGLAVFSKENGALLPLYMLVVEAALFRFRNIKGETDKNIIGFFILFVAVPACLFLVYLFIDTRLFMDAYAGRDFTLAERLLTECRVLVIYLKLIIIPSVTDLGLYHDDIALSRGLLDPVSTLYAIITLTGLALLAVLMLNKRPLISLGIFWFFAGHTLESTILPLEIAHEHRNYLPDFGIILAISSLLIQAPLHKLAPTIRIMAPLLFLLLFSYTTWIRAGQWSDNINLAIYEAMHHPNSFRSVFAAGRIHARLAVKGREESTEKAYAYFQQASELNTATIMPAIVMIKLSYLLERPVNTSWYEEIIYRLQHYPVSPADMTSLRELALCVENKCDVPLDLMEEIFRLFFENKTLQHSKRKHAEVLSLYGYYTINVRGDFEKGLKHFLRAVDIDPKDPQRWINAIDLLTVMKRFDEAEKKLEIFRAAETFGNSKKDYRKLQEAIYRERSKLTTTEQFNSKGNI